MAQPLRGYAADRVENRTIPNAVMGCAIQQFDAVTKREALPIWDERQGLLFTADAMLDNRARLAAEIAPGEPDIPDGALLYRAWLRWGHHCHQHLYGSYAFAVYDTQKNELVVAADYMATRCLYWTRQRDRVVFGTLLGCVTAGMPAPPSLDQDWAADYLTLPFLATGLDPVRTPYTGISRVQPASWLSFAPKGISSGVHWDPRALPPLALDSDEAYQQHFLALMGEVCGDIAARNTPVGIFLSGGMDSSALAAAAAPVFARRGEKLYTYTSVPIAAYKARRDRRVAEDESEEVRQLCAMYPNLAPRFCALEGQDAFTHFDEILAWQETPFKAAPNNMWMYGISEQAQKEGCRIMLNGRTGNQTISFGDKYLELFSLVTKGRLFKAASVLHHTGKRLGGRKRMLRALLANCDFARHPRSAPPTEAQVLDSVYVDRAWTAARGSVGRVQADGNYQNAKPITRRYDRIEKLLNPYGAVTLGEANTKVGLAKGVVMRDLCGERRIVEFCCRVPESCFMKDGVDRRMIRVYMKDLLPASITQNVTQVGIQSADWVVRLKRRWPEVEDRLLEAFEWMAVRGFVDGEKLERELKDFPDHAPMDDLKKLLPMCGIASMRAFLEKRFPGADAAADGPEDSTP